MQRKLGAAQAELVPYMKRNILHCLRISSNNILYEIARFASRNFSNNSLLVRREVQGMVTS